MITQIDIKERVWIDLSDIIDHNLEGFLDLLAERVGQPMLMEIDYTVVGHRSGEIQFKVTGFVESEDGDGRPPEEN